MFALNFLSRVQNLVALPSVEVNLLSTEAVVSEQASRAQRVKEG